MADTDKVNLLQELKRIFRGYRTLNASIKRKLKKLGFTINEHSRHYKLYYPNCSRVVIIPKTCSDYAGGIQIAHEIVRYIP